MLNKRLIFAAFGVGAVALALAACGGASAVDPLDIGDPERGEEIFLNGGSGNARDCRSCHSLDGFELEAPTLQGISAVAAERVPDLSAVEYLRQSILDPSAFVVEGWDDKMGCCNTTQYAERLTEEDVNDLVAFLLTQ